MTPRKVFTAARYCNWVFSIATCGVRFLVSVTSRICELSNVIFISSAPHYNRSTSTCQTTPSPHSSERAHATTSANITIANSGLSSTALFPVWLVLLQPRFLHNNRPRLSLVWLGYPDHELRSSRWPSSSPSPLYSIL